MSIAYGVAAALVAGEIAEANYARMDHPGIARLIGVTRFEISPGLNAAFPAKQGARVTLEFADGSSVTEAREDIAFADEALILARFREAAGARLGADRAARIEAAVDGLATLADAGEIARLCRAGGAA
jgi:2-methylcitrate dehydratase PrpD